MYSSCVVLILCFSAIYSQSATSFHPTNEPTLEPTMRPSQSRTNSPSTPVPTLFIAEQKVDHTTPNPLTNTSTIIKSPSRSSTTSTTIITFLTNNILLLIVCIVGFLLYIAVIIILIMLHQNRKQQQQLQSFHPKLKDAVKSHSTFPQDMEDPHNMEQQRFQPPNLNDIEDESNIEKYINLRKFQKSVDIHHNTTPMGIKSGDNLSVLKPSDSVILSDMSSIASPIHRDNNPLNLIMSPVGIVQNLSSQIPGSQTRLRDDEEGSVVSRGSKISENVSGDSYNKRISYVNGVGSELVLYEESKRNILLTQNESAFDLRSNAMSNEDLSTDDDENVRLQDADTTRGTSFKKCGGYEWIEEALRECDKDDWNVYLERFKRHKLTEERLKHLPNDDEEIWKGVIPEIGVRYQFRALWQDRMISV